MSAKEISVQLPVESSFVVSEGRLEKNTTAASPTASSSLSDRIQVQSSSNSNGYSSSSSREMDHINNSPQRQPSESSPLNSNQIKGHGVMKLLLKVAKSVALTFFPSWIFVKFFVNGIVPPIADNLVPLFFVGNIPNESALALAGQFTFVGVIVEVIQEGIVNSLFYYVGRNYMGNRMQSLQALKISLAILLLLGGILTGLMVVLTPQFVNFIDTPSEIVDATRQFLYTSSFSFPMVLLGAALSNFLLITTSSYLIAAQIANVILSFLFNFFLFGQHSYSLKWGIDQLGYYKIIQATQNCLVNFIFCLIIEGIGPLQFLFKVPFTTNLRSNFKDLFHVSWGNFGDSAIRNFFYFMVTLKFINNLGSNETAAWNLLNSIVWGLLLIPSFTVANYVKVKIGHHGTKTVIRQVAKDAFKSLCCWITIVSILAVIFWPDMANFFGKSNEEAQKISTKLLYEMGWIFIVFSLNNAMDSLFFGVGKTKYVFYQSLFTNLIVYFLPWILYLSNVIQPTYWLVVGLYLGGMCVDFCLTSWFCMTVWKTIPDNLHAV